MAQMVDVARDINLELVQDRMKELDAVKADSYTLAMELEQRFILALLASMATETQWTAAMDLLRFGTEGHIPGTTRNGEKGV